MESKLIYKCSCGKIHENVNECVNCELSHIDISNEVFEEYCSMTDVISTLTLIHERTKNRSTACDLIINKTKLTEFIRKYDIDDEKEKVLTQCMNFKYYDILKIKVRKDGE